MKKILVTGGGGYIGSHAVKKLLKEGYSVVVFDNFSRGYREPLDILKKYGDLSVVEGDLTQSEDLARLFAAHDIAAVMHFAALCLVDESMKKPELYFAHNVVGTLNLLEAMRLAGVRNVIFSSTCAVYGTAQYLPVDEKHPTSPENPYGESKLVAEKMIEWYGRLHGFRYAILRYFNVCGADSEGEIGDSKKPSELLVQNAVRGALGVEEFKLTYPPVATADGSPVRDYVNVEDLIDAHVKALVYLERNESITCNIGTGHGVSVLKIVEAVKKTLGAEFKAWQGRAREGECMEVYANSSLAHNLLGWEAKKSLEENILSLAEWYRKNPSGYAR